jgi:hypothetical protein
MIWFAGRGDVLRSQSSDLYDRSARTDKVEGLPQRHPCSRGLEDDVKPITTGGLQLGRGSPPPRGVERGIGPEFDGLGPT